MNPNLFKTIGNKEIEQLKIEAENSPKKRSRICLHLSHGDLVQESIICATQSNYFRVHKHPCDRSESYALIEGKMSIDYFEDDGRWIGNLILDSNDKSAPFIYRLNASVYHWVRPLTRFVVYHEVLTGPWEKNVVVEYAAFAPDEGEKEKIVQYEKEITAIRGIIE